MQAPAQRQNEPSVVALRGRPRPHGRASRRSGAATARSRSPTSRAGEIYLNEEAARELRRRAAATASSSSRAAPPLRDDGARRRPLRRRRHRRRGAPRAARPGAGAVLGRPGRIAPRPRLEPRRRVVRAPRCSDEVVARSSRCSAPLGLEIRRSKQDAIEDADAAGQRVHGLLHDVRHLLDRRRHPPDLPHLRDARRRAARRARHRPRDRDAAWSPRPDVHVRGRRLRPRRRARRRAARSARRVRDGDSSWRAPSARPTRTRASRSSSRSRRAASSIAFAIGVLLTLVVVAVSAWRVSVMNDLDGDPQPAGAADDAAPAPARARGRRDRPRRAAHASRGSARRPRRPSCSASRSCSLGLVPLLQVAGRVRAARLHGLRPARSSCSLMLPWNLWDGVFGKLAMDFSTWIVAGLMIIVGAVWVIVFNADLLARARHADLRPRSAASRRCCGCRWPIRSPPDSARARRSRCSRSSSSRS